MVSRTASASGMSPTRNECKDCVARGTSYLLRGAGLSFGQSGYLLIAAEKDERAYSPLMHNCAGMTDLASIYSPANRTRLLIAAGVLVTAIAALDWATKPYFSLGFLYLFPIIIVGGFLSRTQIVVAALACAVLQEAFSNLPENEALVRLILSSAGFIGTGLLVSELIRNRRIVLKHVEELENEVRLRHDAEEQLQILVESSPAAIVTIDATGAILLANQAAQQLLAPSAQALRGKRVSNYLPALQTAVESQPSRSFRTTLQCKGQRSTGEAFLAGVWFSTYGTISGPRLAAVVVDLSEDLRDREDLSLDYLLKNSRILMSAVAHEVRNLCGAALVVQKNLARFAELEHNQDFQALSTLIKSLETDFGPWDAIFVQLTQRLR